MGDLTEHFNRSEFACKCGCGFDTIDVETLTLLEMLRQFFREPITITSACRCHEHNAVIGGSQKSLHTQGRACDIVVHNVTPMAVWHKADELLQGKGGLGLYDSFVHVDTRTGTARWKG